MRGTHSSADSIVPCAVDLTTIRTADRDRKGLPADGRESRAGTRLARGQARQEHDGARYRLLPRTFGQTGMFGRGGPNHQPMQNVLAAFDIYRPDIGYVRCGAKRAEDIQAHRQANQCPRCKECRTSRPCCCCAWTPSKRGSPSATSPRGGSSVHCSSLMCAMYVIDRATRVVLHTTRANSALTCARTSAPHVRVDSALCAVL